MQAQALAHKLSRAAPAAGARAQPQTSCSRFTDSMRGVKLQRRLPKAGSGR
jgi:hypothetical protein